MPTLPFYLRRGAKGAAAAAAALLVLGLAGLLGLRLAATLRETHRTEDLAPAGGRQIATSLGSVFVQEAGPPTGPPVLLVHGTAAWSGFWREILDELGRQGFRAVAVDMPPFGFSSRSHGATYGTVEQARRLAEVLDGLAIPRATLVGHSFGSRAAVEAALRSPDRVSALVLVSAALDPDEAAAPPPARAVGSALHTPFVRETLVAATVTNPLATATLLRSMLARKDAAMPEVVAVLQRPLLRRDSTAAVGQWLPSFILPDRSALSGAGGSYASLRMPVALIWGAADEVTPLARAERLRALVPQATLDVLPNVGHIPHIEDPTRFKSVLNQQLRRVATGRPDNGTH